MGHHYVPQFYLRGFEANKRIWAYDQKEKPVSRPGQNGGK
jgi:hypothetical protein